MTDAPTPADPTRDDPEPVRQDPPAEPSSRRSTILRTGVILVLLVVVFGVILPGAVDYGAVIAAFRELDLTQVALVSVAGVAGWFVAGLLMAAVIEGFTPVRGMMAWLIQAGIGASIPGAPVDLAAVWVVARGWGASNAAATSGIALYGVINTLSRLALPLLAVIGLTLTGGFTVDVPVVAWLLAGACAVVFLGGVTLIVVFASSERLATRLGQLGQRGADAVFRRIGRRGPNVLQSVVNFRAQLGGVVRRRGLLAVGLAIANHLAWVGVLTIALLVVGVTTIDYSQVLFAYTVTFVVLIIPIAPGGAGVPELMLIGLLGALAGPGYADQVAAGVFLYRIYSWLLPIPLGWIMLKLARRGQPMLPSGDELRSFAHGETA